MDQRVSLAIDAEAAAAAGGEAHRRAQAVVRPAVVQRQTAARVHHRDRRVDLDVALGVERQRGGRVPAHRVVHEDVAVAPGRALGRGADGDAGAGEVGRQVGAGDVAAVGGDGVVVRVDQPAAGLALGRQRGDFAPGFQGDGGGAGFDEAAVPALRRAGVEQAAVFDLAVAHVGQQQDAPFLLRQRARLHRAAVGDNARRQGVGRLAGHQHLAAVGDDELLVLDQGLHRGRLQRHLQQAVRAGGQRDFVAGGQRHRAQPGADHAFVSHRRRQQCDQTAVGGGDLALVQDAAGGALATEHQPAGEEVLVADVQRGGHQRSHVHFAAAAEHHAGRIHQVDLAVGRQAAVDLAGFARQHPVQRHA